ncbi:MAG TPA: hypothetical protein VE549_15635, partial [Myxococcaceae bacterium]|nr:hypothetical protein [Myxococcaceae bacterium]
MHTKPIHCRALIGTVAAIALAACGGSVTVTGRVTDTEGTQSQGLSSGPAFGGTGTVAAASRIEASSVGSGGALTLISETSIQANGEYQLDVPADSERVVLRALSSSGEVVASALLDAAVMAQGEATRSAPPMSTETSLEAEIFQQLIVDGVAASNIDTVDLRSRVTTQVASSVRAQTTDQERLDSVGALAAAVRAAQEAEIQAYAKAGVTVTEQALFEASLEASAALDSALAAGSRSAEEVYVEFLAAVRSGQQQVDEKTEAEGEREASVAFRASVQARSSSGSSQGVADTAIRAAAGLEAYAADAAIQATLQAAGASDAVIAQATTAAAQLHTSLRAAANAQAAATAWASYSASLSSSANVSSSVLGAF